MLRKPLLTPILILPLLTAAAGCSASAQDEAHSPEEIDRAVDDAQEQGNRARKTSQQAEK